MSAQTWNVHKQWTTWNSVYKFNIIADDQHLHRITDTYSQRLNHFTATIQYNWNILGQVSQFSDKQKQRPEKGTGMDR